MSTHIFTILSLIRVQRSHHLHALQSKPFKSMLNPKYIKYALFGQTWKPIVVYLFVYLACFAFYVGLLPDCDDKREEVHSNVSTDCFMYLGSC